MADRVLAVSCASATAYLTAVDADEDGACTAVLIGPQRLVPVAAGDAGDAAVRRLDAWRAAFATARPRVVALLLPEGGERVRHPHHYWAPRCETETLCVLAAGEAGIPVEVLARATVRTRLGVSGKLDQEVKRLAPVGNYWKDRGLAFLTAQAVVVHAHERGWPELLAQPADGRKAVGDAATR